MNNNRIDFQAELESRLKQIENRNSQKKIKSGVLLQQPVDANQLELNSMIDDNKQKSLRYSQTELFRQQKPHKTKQQDREFLQSIKQTLQNKPKAKRHQYSMFSLIQDQQLAAFLYKYFGKSTQEITLDKFIEKIIIEYEKNIGLTDNDIRNLYLHLESIITTTNTNLISLNALQVSLKNSQLHFATYVESQFLNAIYESKINTVRIQEERNKKQMNQKVEELVKNEKRYKQKISTLKEREQQMIKKQQLISKKEKQLTNKLKNYKMILEERADKLLSNALEELTTVSEKIDKKINSFQRNIKYKIENLSKKVGEIHRLREYDEANIRKNISRQVVQKAKKQQKTALNKLQKENREKQGLIEHLNEQKQKLEQESEKLLKICSNLENKVSKLQKQIKHSKNEIDQSIKKSKQNEYLLKEKQYQIQELQKALDSHKNVNSQRKNLNSQRKKVKTNNKQNTIFSLGQIVEVYELLLPKLLSIKDDESIQLAINDDQEMYEKLFKVFDVLLTQNINCEMLVGSYLNHITTTINRLKQKQSITFLTSYKGSIQFVQSLQINHNFNPNHHKQFLTNLQNAHFTWKICVINILTTVQTVGWLSLLSSLLQQEEIRNEFIHKNNYLLAIIEKVRVVDLCNKSLGQEQVIEIIEGVLDLILGVQITNNKQLIKQIIEKDGYRGIIEIFILMAKLQKKTKGDLFEILQKISIIIQRIMYFEGKNIRIEKHEITLMKELLEKYESTDSILVHNFKSVLSIAAFL